MLGKIVGFKKVNPTDLIFLKIPEWNKEFPKNIMSKPSVFISYSNQDKKWVKGYLFKHTYQER